MSFCILPALLILLSIQPVGMSFHPFILLSPELLAPYAFLLGLPHTSIQPLSIHPEGIFSFHLIDLLRNIFYNLLFCLQGSTHLLTPLQCPPSTFPTLASSPPFQLHPSGRDSSEPQLVQPCLCSSNSSRSKELVLTHPRYLKGSIAIHSAGRNLYSAPPTPYHETSITLIQPAEHFLHPS